MPRAPAPAKPRKAAPAAPKGSKAAAAPNPPAPTKAAVPAAPAEAAKPSVEEPVWLVRIVLALFLAGFAAFLAREVYAFVQSLP